MLLSTAETYKELETFESVEALNEATRKHRSSHDLSDTETAILDVLARHSCVYKGVSYLSKSNIARQVGRVRRTVIRACNRLEALGIIKQVAMKRVSGDRRQTSNAVVILQVVGNIDVPKGVDVYPCANEYTYTQMANVSPVEQSEEQKESRVSNSNDGTYHNTANWTTSTNSIRTEKLAELRSNASMTNGSTSNHLESAQVTPGMSRHKAILSFKRRSSNTYKDTCTPANALQNSIPQAIYEALAPFYDYDGLYKAYGVLLRAKASIDRTITVEEYADTFTGIFANAIRKMKRGLIDRDKLNGYLYVAWREACTVIDRQRVYAAYSQA